MSGIIRVLLVDGNKATREGLNRMLCSEEGIMVIGEAESGEVAMTKAQELSPDVTIVHTGNSMQDKNIISSACAFDEAEMPARVIVMAENPLQCLVPAMKAGAAALLPDNVGRNELLSAIRRIHLWFPSSLSSDGTLPDWDTTL